MGEEMPDLRLHFDNVLEHVLRYYCGQLSGG
jgi:hypothetical protein